jgi:hypothetical protein
MFYDILTANDVTVDAGVLDAVNLAVDHVDANLILVDAHELVWETRSAAGLVELDRVIVEMGLHLRVRRDNPVPVATLARRSDPDPGERVYEVLRVAGLV